jgi:hypothetical protein
MSLGQLSREENLLVKRCLLAAANGPFFPDWEFETLLGVTRETIAKLGVAWPAVDLDNDDVNCGVLNAVNNLIGYPHGLNDQLHAEYQIDPEALRRLVSRIRTK